MYWVCDIGDLSKNIQSEQHNDQQKFYVEAKDETFINIIQYLESVLGLLYQLKLILA